MKHYVYKPNIKFEHIHVKNCEVFREGEVYNLYVLDSDIFIGPTLLLASKEERADLEFFSRAEVFRPTKSWVLRTRRVE